MPRSELNTKHRERPDDCDLSGSSLGALPPGSRARTSSLLRSTAGSVEFAIAALTAAACGRSGRADGLALSESRWPGGSFDKSARHIDALGALGFGCIE